MIRLTQLATQTIDVSASLTLTYEQRTRSRLKVTLDDGREAGLFLPRGRSLRDGDILAGEDGIAVVVRAAREQVSTVRCTEPLLFAKACYHLGNRHVALQIDTNRLRYKHDHVLDEMIRGRGLDVLIEDAAFEPESGAYHSHGAHESTPHDGHAAHTHDH